MEIEVGEYVRTIDGETGKVKHIIQDMIFINSNQYYHTPDKIKKHSKNIIDLIEVGDYVNGLEVLDIYIPSDLWDTIEIRVNDKYTNFITPEDIKSIVTKEQFKLCEYRLEE